MKKNTILFFCVVLFSLSSLPVHADEDLTFPAWLKKHEAWDSYEKVLERGKNTPEIALERAYSFLHLGEATAAIEVLEELGRLTNENAEAERLWLYGSALRLKGDYFQAVLTLSKALTFYEPRKQKELLQSQPTLPVLWEDVWRQWLWESLATPLLQEGRYRFLVQVAAQAESAWPQKTFWKQANQLIRKDSFATIGESHLESASNSDRLAAARALLASSIGFNEIAISRQNKIQNNEFRLFWQTLLACLYSSDTIPFFMPKNLSSTATHFFEVYGQELIDSKEKNWQIAAPDIHGWKKLHEELSAMSPNDALQRLEKELESSLIPDNLRTILKTYAFTFRLLSTDVNQPEENRKLRASWNDVAQYSPPLVVKFCALLVFGEHQDFSGEPLYPALCSLATAAGFVPHVKLQGSFGGRHSSSLFDPLSQYINLKEQFLDGKEKKEAALHLAYLFPKSVLAQNALFFLAKQAQIEKKPILAWRYLEKISLPALPKSMEIDYFLAKAGLEMQLGKEKEALNGYLDVLEKNPRAISPEKKLRLALLAQQQNKWQIADKLLQELWEQKDELSLEVQAETLFWIGEGQQFLGNIDKALEAYLRLGWKYPKENMWAVTALYRAGLIYEQQGKSAAAKKLYATVLKNSGRKSQKKAAEERIKAIDSGAGGKEEALF